MQKRYTKLYFERYALLNVALSYEPGLLALYRDGAKHESPDFQSEELGIGLEITRAVSAQHARELSMINRSFKAARAEGLQRRVQDKGAERVRLANAKAVLFAQQSASKANVYLELIRKRMVEKTKKLNGNYKLFPNNWLYIFAHTRVLGREDVLEARRGLQPFLGQDTLVFDKIFVDCIDQVFIIGKALEISSFPIDEKTRAMLEDRASETGGTADP